VPPQGRGTLFLVPRIHTAYSHGKEVKKEPTKDLKLLLPPSCYLLTSVALGPGRLGLAVPELLL